MIPFPLIDLFISTSSLVVVGRKIVLIPRNVTDEGTLSLKWFDGGNGALYVQLPLSK